MAINNLNQLSEIQLDTLKEIGNIGAGNAITSLSSLLNMRIDMSVPVVRILDLNEATCIMGGPEKIVIGVLVKLYGDIEAIMVLILDRDFAYMVLNTLLGECTPDWSKLTLIQISAIAELGNIMISSYCVSISSLSDLNIKTSIPSVTVDMAGAILSVAAIEMSTVSDKVIFIEDVYAGGAHDYSSNMMLIPSIDSLNRLMQKLGINL